MSDTIPFPKEVPFAWSERVVLTASGLRFIECVPHDDNVKPPDDFEFVRWIGIARIQHPQTGEVVGENRFVIRGAATLEDAINMVQGAFMDFQAEREEEVRKAKAPKIELPVSMSLDAARKLRNGSA